MQALSLSLSLILAAALSATAPLAADGTHLDSVILSDGTRLTGLVVEDAADHVSLQSNGVERRLGRDRVLKVGYNDPDAPLYQASAEADVDTALPEAAGPEAATAGAIQAGADPELTDYCNGVAEYYKVPVWQVVSVQQRVAMQEVPVVFQLALGAHVTPSVVLGLRLGGLSWAQVGLHLGLGNDLFYLDGGSVVLGTPYARLYTGFWSLPRARWAALRLSDRDIIDCVNIRFVHTYYRRPVREVVHVTTPFHRHAWRPLRRTVVVHESRPARKVVVHESRPARKVVVHESRPARKVVVHETRPDRRTGVHEARPSGKPEVHREGRHDGKDGAHEGRPEPTAEARQEHKGHGGSGHGNKYNRSARDHR